MIPGNDVPTPHPLSGASASVITVLSDSELTINFSSVSDPLRFEASYYANSIRGWICKLASSCMFNTEKSRRMVSHIFLSLLDYVYIF